MNFWQIAVHNNGACAKHIKHRPLALFSTAVQFDILLHQQRLADTSSRLFRGRRGLLLVRQTLARATAKVKGSKSRIVAPVGESTRAGAR